jgi:predicted NUDIX family phosphoesterase
MLEVETEQVLVVPTARFHEVGYFQGFSADSERYLAALLDAAHLSYRPRYEMERDPGFKQLIPYVIFSHDDPVQGPLVFQYTRGGGQGERRLHAKRSIGVGGHISVCDGRVDGASRPYDEGLRRELAEEVDIQSPYAERCVGLINDDRTEVGRVHLGVVHRLAVAQPAVYPREPDLLEAGFRPLAELWEGFERLESWSQICLEALFPRR